MLYFDQSATSLHKPHQVIQAVSEALGETLGNPARGAHTPASLAMKALAKARRAVAGYFGVPPLCVAFTANATMSLNMSILGALTPKDRVLTTCWSHNAMLRPLYQLQDQGMKLDILFTKPDCCFSISDLEDAIHPRTTAIAINAMSNVTGDVMPLSAVAKVCHQHNLLLIVDLAQWAGTKELPEFNQWPNKTLISFTGHKSLYGPQGTGGLINLGGVKLKPVITGGSGVSSFERTQPLVFPDVCETGTPNLPGIMGLAAGIDWIQQTGQRQIADYLLKLRSRFTEGLSSISGVKLYGEQLVEDYLSSLGPVVSMNIRDLDSAFVSQTLDEEHGIATRPGAHCAPLWHENAGTQEQGTVRFSFSYFHCPSDVDQALDAIARIAFRE